MKRMMKRGNSAALQGLRGSCVGGLVMALGLVCACACAKPPAKEEELLAAIGRWEREVEELDSILPPEEIMRDYYKLTAIKCLMVGQAKMYIDQREDKLTTYDLVRDAMSNGQPGRRLREEGCHGGS